MKNKTITYYADPSHAWAKVKIKELIKLNIADKISQYSYIRGEYVYLEEDCDLGIYVNALKDNGINPIFKGYTGNRSSKIRSYYRYNKEVYNESKM